MLGIDECGKPPCLLSLGDHVEGHGCLAGGLGTIYLDDAPARDAANAECNIQRQNSRRYDLDIHVCLGFTKTHDCALSMCFLNLLEGIFERLLTRHGFIFFAVLFIFFRHIMRSFKLQFSFQLYENPRAFVKKNVRGCVALWTII